MNDYENGQPAGGSTETSVEMRQQLLNESNSRFMEYLLDNDPLFEKVLRRMKGEVWDFNEKRFVKKYEAKLDDEGIDWVMLQLEVLTDKILQTSKYKGEDINRDIEDFEINLMRFLSSHANKYGLRNTVDIDMIHYLLTELIKGIRNKSQDGTMLRAISQSTQHTEVVSDRQGGSNGKSRFWSKFKEQVPI